jgi:thiol:disulfide interchange protein DsbD
MKKIVFLVLILITFGFPTLARISEYRETEPQPPVLKFSYEGDLKQFEVGKEGMIYLTISVPSNYHIYGGKELSVNLDSDSLKVEDVSYPKPQMEEDFAVYRGDVIVKIKVKALKEVNAYEGKLKIKWQGCQDFGDKVCFMPTESNIPLKISVKNGKDYKTEAEKGTEKPVQESAADSLHYENLFKDFKEAGRFAGYKSPEDFKKWFENVKGGVKEEKNLFEKVAKDNILLALFIAIFFGFLSSLTPCVYPVIPITIAYIGSKSRGKGKFSGFILSLFFVLGLALVYASLGVISSMLGVSFGSLTQKPIVGVPIAIIFALLGFSMFGLFEIAMPSRFSSKIEAEKKKGKGYFGAFLIGALTGLVASPCIGPLLLAILVIVASLGSIFLGFLYLFAFALGMGILFIVIGTFSGVLASLPKSGGWMDSVKIIFGSLIFAASFYFANLYLDAKWFYLFSGVVVGFAIGFLLYGYNKHFLAPLHRVFGIVLTIVAFLVILPFSIKSENSLNETQFETEFSNAILKSRETKRPLLLDFRAQWCAACLELEKKTYPSKEGGEVLKQVVPLKVDFTKESEETKQLTKYFKIEGLPTVILLETKNGDEAKGQNISD